MSNRISIIVPIYNSSKTLDRCIKSIINQSYRNIEILLIDDGSTDESASICKKYEKKDNRIKYIYKDNSGVGETRNYGIKIATGNYIGFVDSDDEVLPQMYEKLINANIDKKYDIIGCSNYDTDENTGINIKRTLELKEGLQEKERIICDVLYQTKNAWGAVWNKIFKKEVFNNIKFPKNQNIEDYLVTLKAYDKFTVFFVNEPLYIHYAVQNSLSHRPYDEKMLKSYETIDEISEYFRRQEVSKKIKIGCDYLGLSLSEFICRSIWHDRKNTDAKLIKKIKKQEKKKGILKYGTFSAIKLYIKINIYYLFVKFRKVR